MIIFVLCTEIDQKEKKIKIFFVVPLVMETLLL